MLGVQGALGEGAPISRKTVKGRSVFDEKSEDGAVPEGRAREPVRPGRAEECSGEGRPRRRWERERRQRVRR